MALSLSKLPWYAQVGAFVLLAGTGAGLFYNYYEVPARADLASRQQQLKALHVDIDKGLAAAKKLPEFRAEVDALELRLTSLRAVLPEEKDAADLLRRMQTVATQSNLTITSFKPAPVVTKELHAEWPINLELEGNYHNLATFFDRLGKFTRIVNISALDVKGKDKDKAQPNTTIAAKCVATTFVLLDKPVEAAKPDAKPAAKGKPAAPKKVA
jgi:type IV pilus assembly protein PilO